MEGCTRDYMIRCFPHLAQVAAWPRIVQYARAHAPLVRAAAGSAAQSRQRGAAALPCG